MKKASSAPNGRSAKRQRQEQEQENGKSTPPNESQSPIHVVTPSSTYPQESIDLQSQSLLKDLLHPLSPQEFMIKHFRQRAVHVKASSKQEEDNNVSQKKKNKADATTNRYQPIIEHGMYNLNTEELVKDTSSDSIFVWLAAAGKDQKKSGRTNRYHNPLIQSIELPDADTALALHQSTGNHALYCRAPPSVEQVLAAKLLKGTGLGAGQYDPTGESIASLARGEVEMFITAKAGGITDWHYDFQENFTIQLSGVKKWTLQKGTVQHPLRACTPHYKAPDVVEHQLKAAHLSAPEFCFEQPTTREQNSQHYNTVGPTDVAILKPGDALYFPAGMWHQIEVLEPGVSINVSLMATNYANITCQALQHYLLQRDEWRQVLVQNDGADLNALEHLKKLLKDLPGIIKEFEQQQGGAQAILPPVLLQPPNFHSNEEGSEGGNEEDQAEDGKPPAKKSQSNNKQDNDSDEDMEEEGSEENEGVPDADAENGDWEEVVMEEEEDDNFVAAGEFQYPPEYNGPCAIDADATVTLLNTHRLIRNPLASLLGMNEITQYYNERLHNKDSHSDGDLFVLNVNFAGVESHESAVRVLLRDDSEQKYLVKMEGSPSQKLAQEMAEDCPNLIHCLLYYGFFVLVPKQ